MLIVWACVEELWHIDKLFADYSSNSIKFEAESDHFASSPWRTCWGLLERRRPSQCEHRSRWIYIYVHVYCTIYLWFMMLQIHLNIFTQHAIDPAMILCFSFMYLLNEGFHLKMPLITHFEPIQVTLQTDLVTTSLSLSLCLYTHIHTYIYIYIHIFTFEHSSIKYSKSLDYFKNLWSCGLILWCFRCDVQVRDIPCGTKGGVMINFEKIEVMFLILPSFPAKSCVWLVNA